MINDSIPSSKYTILEVDWLLWLRAIEVKWTYKTAQIKKLIYGYKKADIALHLEEIVRARGLCNDFKNE